MVAGMNRKKTAEAGKIIFLYTIAFLCVFPAVIVLLHSFMGSSELWEKFHLLPKKWTFSGYDRLVFTQPEYFDYFWNSVSYCLFIMLPGLPLALFGGYGFTFERFRYKRALLLLYIVLMLMPFQATLVPQYLVLKRLGLLNTRACLILPNLFAPFGTILVAQFMKNIDANILEAGRMDGLSRFGLFSRLVLPMCLPVIGAWMILTFIECWAMFEQPMIFLEDMEKLPLSVRLYYYPDDKLFPGSVIYMILPLLFLGMNRKKLTESIGFGSIQ